jgi:hypothetical protein
MAYGHPFRYWKVWYYFYILCWPACMVTQSFSLCINTGLETAAVHRTVEDGIIYFNSKDYTY